MKLCGFSVLLLISMVGRADIKVLQVTPGIPAAGSLATVYCTGLVGISGLLTGSGVPLPTSLGGVHVTFGTVDAPLLGVNNVQASDGSFYQQINFQVPYEAPAAIPRIVQGDQSATIAAPPAPWGIFSNVFQHAADYRPVTFNDPPRPGEWIIAYGTNFGEVQNPSRSGFPAAADPLSPASTLIAGLDLWHFRLRLDNVISEIPLQIGYLGLAPGTVGIYQLNFRMPDQLPNGPAWIHLQRVANCGARPNPGCGLGIRMDVTTWVPLYQ